MCIVAIGGDFQSSLETTAYLKDLGAKLVVSRAARDVQARFLLRNGADEVVYPEKQLANWTAIRYSSEHILIISSYLMTMRSLRSAFRKTGWERLLEILTSERNTTSLSWL